MNNEIKNMADGAAVVVGISGVMGWMIPIVTFIGGVLTIVWMGIRIWETNTVQKLVKRDAIDK
jgi:hypothetical protein